MNETAELIRDRRRWQTETKWKTVFVVVGDEVYGFNNYNETAYL